MESPPGPLHALPEPAQPAATRSVMIRRMGLQDLSFVVATHRAEFGDGFFARLGPRFLARYYRTFLDGPAAVAVIAEDDGTRCGYLTGVLRTGEHRALLLRYHGVGLAAYACAAMLRHPKLGFDFLTTRSSRYLRGLTRGLTSRAQTAGPNSGGETAVLTHIVVDESHRNRGIGRQLLNYFLTEASHVGCTRAALVTVMGNSGAAAFYEVHGWTRSGSAITPEGRSLWRYTISLPRGRTECGNDA
jgi:GNAT superfamily N-acetyltransferase